MIIKINIEIYKNYKINRIKYIKYVDLNSNITNNTSKNKT